MGTDDIRAIIAAALRNECETHQLRLRVELQLPQLQQKLVLPEQDPVSALMAFITGYVESVPGCLSLVTAVSKRLGFFDYAAPFLHLAQDYFLQPPHELPQDGRVEAVLGKTPLEVVQALRVDQAVHLLRTTDWSVDRIAVEVGYAHGSSLRGLLRESLGKGVGELRGTAAF